jgi:hypothetical protein
VDDKDYIYSEKDDIYGFGMLLYMMTTLIHDPKSISDSLKIPATRSFTGYLKEKLSITGKYSSKLIYIIEGAIHPYREKRISIEEIRNILNGKSFQWEKTDFKFEDKYRILKEIDHLSLTSLQNSSKKDLKIELSNTTVDCVVSYIYVVEEKNDISKRCNAFCATFQDNRKAIEFYNYSNMCKEFDHPNLVPIRNTYLEQDESGQYRVYVVKVS